MALIKKFRIKSFKNPQPIISLDNISLSFGNRKILDNVSFKINHGQILGMLGPNGVGKSTIFNLITGLIKPDYGKITFRGTVVNDYPIYLRTTKFKIGYVPQYGGYFGDLTLLENLKAIAEIVILEKELIKNKIDQLFEESLRDYTAAVEPELWSKIDQQLNNKTKKNIYFKYAAAVAILIGFVLVFQFNDILNPTENKNLAIVEQPGIAPETPNSISVQSPITTKIKKLSDPRIAGVVEVKSKAKEKNTSLKISQQDYALAKAQYESSRAVLLPQIRLSNTIQCFNIKLSSNTMRNNNIRLSHRISMNLTRLLSR